MLNRYWGSGLAIGGLAIVLLWGWLTEPKLPPLRDMPAAQEASSEQRHAPEEPRIICEGNCDIRLGNGVLAESQAEPRIPNAADDKADHEATAGDLLAQQRMAHWAGFTALLTALGVVAVILTLRAALDANRGFRESSERQLRAYVSFRETHLEKRLDGRIGVLSRWENTGQTPTRRAASQMGYEFRTDDLPPDFAYPDTAAGPPQPQNLGAGQSRKTGGLELGASDQTRLVNEQIRLFVWGWLEYSDVFEGTPRRRSEFCVEVLAISNTIEIMAKSYGPHNGTDGDCLKPPQTT